MGFFDDLKDKDKTQKLLIKIIMQDAGLPKKSPDYMATYMRARRKTDRLSQSDQEEIHRAVKRIRSILGRT